MMFRLKHKRGTKGLAGRGGALAVVVALAIAGMGLDTAAADVRYAVVPKRTIYPGEQLEAAQLEEVEVTNPNIAPGFAEEISAVSGLITKKTLLAGRIILVSSLREPFAVARGKTVRLVFQNGPLTITASGTPLEDAAVGDLIKVRNMDSGVIVSGTVMGDHTVHVVAK